MFSPVDSLIHDALKDRVFSAASLLLATPERILFRRTWGLTREGGRRIDEGTRFDLASLTKPLFTTTLCMEAVCRQDWDLDHPLSLLLPGAHVPPDKQTITLRHLLNHCSGLPPHRAFYSELIRVPAAERRQKLLSLILGTPLLAPPGRAVHYSDLGFMLLGMALDSRRGEEEAFLCSAFARSSFSGLSRNGLPGFIPLEVGTDPRALPTRLLPFPWDCVATERCAWRHRLIQGEVHDENGYCLGGVAGHAGLFGSAQSIFPLLSFLWGIYRGTIHHCSWSRDVVSRFWQRQSIVPESTWALGYDTPSPANSSAGRYFSPRSVGHLGFTGTSFWMDLDQEALIILLTNRIHPTRENPKLKIFRPHLHNLVMEAFYAISRH